MSFVDQRFPAKYAYGAVATDEWVTEIVESASRVEVRNSPAENPRRSWDLATNAKTSDERAGLHAWFLALRGALRSFAFRDPADHMLARQTIGSGNGTRTTYQIYKLYAIGSASYSRDVTKPVTSTVQVWLNGVLQTTGYSVDRTSGVVTFASAPTNGHAIEVACEFDVPVRFAQSRLSWKAANRSPTDGVLWVCSELSLIEVLGE